MTSFSASASTWKRFFSLATIDYHLTNVAIEVRKKGLFVSAINKPTPNCWALVKHDGFKTKGEGIFAIDVEEIQRAIRLMEGDEVYTGSVTQTKLQVNSEHDHMEFPLESLEDHQDESNSKSSWIAEIEVNGKQRRWYRNLYYDKNKLPFPARPPQIGESKSSTHYEQILTVNAEDLNATVKRARILGETSVAFQTGPKHDTMTVYIENKTKFSHQKMIELTNGKTKINFQESFAEPIGNILSLAEGEVKVAMTTGRLPEDFDDDGKVTSLLEKNAGIWFIIQDEDLLACYLVTILTPEEQLE